MRRGPVSVEEYLSVPGRRVALVEYAVGGRSAPALVRIAELAPWLVVTTLDADAGPCPRVTLRAGDEHGALTFVGALEGRLLEPFVEVLRALATRSVEWDTPATPALYSELRAPVTATLAVSASCPHCPSVAAALARAALATPLCSVVIARADQGFVEGVASVPTLIVNGRVAANTPLGEYALAQALVR